MRDDELSLRGGMRKLVDAGTPPEKIVHLRGAGWKLLKRLRRHAKDVAAGKAERRVFEVLVDGPGGTGKSHANAQILWYFGNRYPGIRILVVREVRADLATTFQKVWEEDVVPKTHPMLARPQSRVGRNTYNFWNGPQKDGAHPTVGATVIELGGMDNVQRLRGTDYDIVLFPELVECRAEPDYAELLRSLRNWGGWQRKIPFQLLLSETNPDAPDNWVNIRFLEENMQRLMDVAASNGVPYTIWRLTSKHEDNPKWYDKANKEWHPEGRAYIAALDAIPGVRGQRLRWGRWVGAEGMVYEFDRSRHIIERPKPRPIFRAFVAAMDWGYTDPCAFGVFGIERDTGWVHEVVEIYRKKMSIDWWVDRVIELKGEFNLRALVVDPSRPEVIEKFNRAVCADPATPFAIPAVNKRASDGAGDMGGIDTVRWYLEPRSADDPRGRLVHWADRMRYGPDPLLVEEKAPTNGCAEYGTYVYRSAPRSGVEIANRRKELTDDTCPDHSMDKNRYALTYIKDRYGKFIPEVNPTQHVSARDRQMARDLGIELPPEPEA